MGKLFKFKTYNPSEGEIDFDSFIKFPDFCHDLVFLDFKTTGLRRKSDGEDQTRCQEKLSASGLICLAAGASSSLANSVPVACDLVEVPPKRHMCNARPT